MHLKFDGVNDAFRTLVQMFATREITHCGGRATDEVPIQRTSSRNGPVLMLPEPMTITYRNPRHRVLFNPLRDANPFFHAYEALWMLAGRNDAAPLVYYSSKVGQYSDDGKEFNGAYGYRWRHSKVPGTALGDTTSLLRNTKRNVDQIALLVNHLKSLPESRRAVLQMWNVEDDLLKIGPDITGCGVNPPSKDVCCNLSVMFSLRRTWPEKDEPGEDTFLDMTVTNRSNDMILGCLGANVVHFSMLQEYVAAQLGAEVGLYHHFTSNLHCYESNWQPEKWLSDYENGGTWSHEWYASEIKHLVPLVRDPTIFDKELPEFVELNYSKDRQATRVSDCLRLWSEPWLETVGKPMCQAFHSYKRKDYTSALSWCRKIAADDWRIACAQWIERRRAKAGGSGAGDDVGRFQGPCSSMVHDQPR